MGGGGGGWSDQSMTNFTLFCFFNEDPNIFFKNQLLVEFLGKTVTTRSERSPKGKGCSHHGFS